MEQAAPATILVVDDNAINRELAKATLEDEGHRVLLANGGQDGIAQFATHGPDCVLLDIRMPDLDGFAVCAWIRNLPRGKETPILFVTAARDVDTFDNAMLAGGDDFLTKPIRPNELLVRVQTALALRQAKSEAREHYALVKKQRDDLLRVQLQKERLSAFLVHDLKNPVNTMDLHAQLVLRDSNASAAVREAAATIRDEAKKLSAMIMNLLDISKADEGRLSPSRTTVPLASLADQLFAEHATTAAAREVGFCADFAVPTANVDRDLFHRVLTNLLDNALRYAPRGSEITLGSRRSATGVEIRVSDLGPGIPPELRARAFEPFVQIDDAAKSRAGRGLGLSFCRSAVEAHGGTIDIEDTKTGTTFSIRLPDVPPEAS